MKYTREQLVKARHKMNKSFADVPKEYAHDKEFFRSKDFADSQIDELLMWVDL